MVVFIALLRAVNVGGTAKLSMTELKAACQEAGLSKVSTYISSGNLVFESNKSSPEVKTIIAALLRDRFKLDKNDTIIRTLDDLIKVLADNPFADAARERPNLLMVNYVDGLPAAGAADALAAFHGPERLQLIGEHLYIDYREGIAKSKLTPAFLNKALKTPSTSRNWNTTNKLLELARKLQG